MSTIHTDALVVIVHAIISTLYWYSIVRFAPKWRVGYRILWFVGAGVYWFVYLICPFCYLPVTIVLFSIAVQRRGEPATTKRFSIIRVLALLLMVIAVGLVIVFAAAPSLIMGE